MSENIDTNINNYTLSELLLILDLNSEYDIDEIKDASDYFISKYDKKKDPKMTNFFRDVKSKLLNYYGDLINENDNEPNDAEFTPSQIQTSNWIQNQYLKQSNKTQNNKITERKQKIDVYANQHVPMNKEQLGINNNYNVEVAQDVLNPNLKNITSRFINLDSQFRQPTGGVESSSTDYTLDLSEPLNNVLSLRLYSVQIPYTWYSVDVYYGNTCFWIIIDENTTVTISVPSGNYSTTQFVTELNSCFSSKGFTNLTIPGTITPVSFNSNNGKITINLYNYKYNGITFNTNNTYQIIFFDVTGQLTCGSTNCNQININNINQTLGWLMGYRSPYIYLDISGNTAPSLIDLYGPKYLILSIDDYNQNHINNGLVTITELSKNLKLPSYYNPGFPIKCTLPINNLSTNMDSNEVDNGDLLMDKLNLSFKNIPQVLPTAPRILTQAQIYSINEIMKNNERNTNFRSKAPTNSDTFALIPIKHNSQNSTGDVYVEFGGSLQDNKRIYFGPVNIDRMRVKLLDDKGNVLNMNGVDWSITLIAEILYQY
jgi:hypothetical protein